MTSACQSVGELLQQTDIQQICRTGSLANAYLRKLIEPPSSTSNSSRAVVSGRGQLRLRLQAAEQQQQAADQSKHPVEGQGNIIEFG